MQVSPFSSLSLRRAQRGKSKLTSTSMMVAMVKVIMMMMKMMMDLIVTANGSYGSEGHVRALAWL